MSEFIPSICWMDFDYTISTHMKLWRDLNIKGIRGFFNTDDIPQGTPSQSFIQYCFDTMPNPQHAWTYENQPLTWMSKGNMRDIFTVCKQEKWLPIISFGCQEETPHGWLGRAIPEDKWDWLVEFVRQFGLYLKNTMGFQRVDFEWWNEPTKLEALGWGYDKYCKLGNKLAIAWHSVSPDYKFYAFSDDLTKMYYLDYILADKTFCGNIDVISTHIGVGSEDSEWDEHKIAECNTKIAKYSHLKQSVTELTCNGIIDRLDQLPNQTIGYGHIGLNRHLINGNLLGTRMDEYAIWDDNYFEITAQDKINYSANFNKTNYKPYVLEDDDMILTFDYKSGSKGMGVKFLQKVCNKVLAVTLVIDGNWGPKTEEAIKDLNENFGFVVNPEIVDKTRFKFYVANYPEIWNDCEVSYASGER